MKKLSLLFLLTFTLFSNVFASTTIECDFAKYTLDYENVEGGIRLSHTTIDNYDDFSFILSSEKIDPIGDTNYYFDILSENSTTRLGIVYYDHDDKMLSLFITKLNEYNQPYDAFTANSDKRVQLYFDDMAIECRKI